MKMFSIKRELPAPNAEKNISAQDAAAIRGTRQGLYFLGRELYKTAREGILKPPKTGRLYVVRKTGKSGKTRNYNHQASAPGEFPANQSGTLRGGISFLVVGAKRLEFGSETEYGRYLEEGTRLMARRPFLEPSVKRNEGNAAVILPREMQRAVLYAGRS